MKSLDELIEAKVLAIVEKDGRYVGKLGCVLCLSLRNAATRLVAKGVLECKGVWDGQQVWVKKGEQTS
jgi:hypothetical protein